jgi:RimJ/RimL family protein N-acetyltransferase
VRKVNPLHSKKGVVLPQSKALDADYRNQGYVTEGATASLEFGFRWLQAEEIVSFRTSGNIRSRRVMEKIGMTRSASDDFDHPLVAPEECRRAFREPLAGRSKTVYRFAESPT